MAKQNHITLIVVLEDGSHRYSAWGHRDNMRDVNVVRAMLDATNGGRSKATGAVLCTGTTIMQYSAADVAEMTSVKV